MLGSLKSYAAVSLYLLASSLTFTSCSHESPRSSDTVRDSAGVEIVQNETLPVALPTYRLGELLVSIGEAEGPDEVVLSRVGGAADLGGGRIAVADNGSRSLRIYSTSGELLRSFGSPGEGPRDLGFLLGPWRLANDSASLAIFDPRLQRTTLLTDQADFVGVETLNPPAPNPGIAGILRDGTTVLFETEFTPELGSFDRQMAHIVVFRPPDRMRDTIYSVASHRLGFVLTPRGRLPAGPAFEAHALAIARGNQIIVSDCRSPEFREVDASGSVHRIVRWATGAREITDEDHAQLRNERLERLTGEQRKAAENALDAAPANDVFPACDGAQALRGFAMQIGVDGRVWIRRFLRPEDDSQRWLVFENGRLMATAEFPESVSVQELGADYVILVERDEFDVERVRKYRLESQ